MSIKAPRLPDDFDESAINHGDSLSFDTSIRRFVTAPAVSHESINIAADTSLPVTHPVLTVRATADATVGVEDAPDGTVVTVHVAEGWERITWAPGITVTGATDTTETWVVLVRAEGAWQALVSGEQEVPAEPDTGWIDYAADVDPAICASGFTPQFKVRRIGRDVFYDISIVLVDNWPGGPSGVRVPDGFIPDDPIRLFIFDRYSYTAAKFGRRLTVYGSGGVSLDRGYGEANFGADWPEATIRTSFVTTQPWPPEHPSIA